MKSETLKAFGFKHLRTTSREDIWEDAVGDQLRFVVGGWGMWSYWHSEGEIIAGGIDDVDLGNCLRQHCSIRTSK